MSEVNPIILELFRSVLTAIAEEMGAVLTRSSYSPNIKEMRDFSCAIFDRQGRLIAQAAHIPVHLGSMPDSVVSALKTFDHFAPGDIIALNDPFYEFTDYLDNDGFSDQPIPITARVKVLGDTLSVDFTGSAPQTRSNVNTVASVAKVESLGCAARTACSTRGRRYCCPARYTFERCLGTG